MSGPNAKKEDSLFKKFWDRPTKAQRDSDGESGIKISIQRSKTSFSNLQTKTDVATLQQSKQGIVLFEVSTNMNITLCCPRRDCIAEGSNVGSMGMLIVPLHKNLYRFKHSSLNHYPSLIVKL